MHRTSDIFKRIRWIFYTAIALGMFATLSLTIHINALFVILTLITGVLCIIFEYSLPKLISQQLNRNIIPDLNSTELQTEDVTGANSGKNNAQLELSNAEILFNRFWEISVDGMRMTDESGKIIAVNKAFCKIMHKERRQLLGYPFSITYHEDHKKEAINYYQNDVKNNALKTHFETERILWNGRKVWLEFSNSFLDLPEHGTIVLSVINDITERKQAELLIQMSENRFRTLFNNADDAVFVNLFTSDGKLGAFSEVNNLACFRLGYTREEFLALDVYDLFPKKYHAVLDQACLELADSDHTLFESMQIRKDHRQIPVEVKSHKFMLDDRISILSIARDITERKQAEKKLNLTSQTLRKLASRLQTIREEERTMIAREIHDELGQALTVLKIQIALLLNKIKMHQPDLENKMRSIGELIDQTVESVQKISAKLRPGILDELGLIPAIEWQTQEFENRTGILCDCIVPDREITIDQEKATAIFRILQEALTNAARHAGAKKVSVILKIDGNVLTLEVTDNGRGIRTGQKNDPNSLGLLGMRERALVFGGDVSIHGVSGKGTNVKVEIPHNL